MQTYNQETRMFKDEEDTYLSLKERIYNFLKRDAVSFAEIEKYFGTGHCSYGIKENTWFWFRLPQETGEIISELFRDKKILFYPTTPFTYLIDGIVPQVPVAKTTKDYKTDHWFPVVIWRTDRIKGKLKPSEIKIYRKAGWNV